MKDNFELGERLESVFPLLDMVFEYLSDKDLDNCIKVKRSWGPIAKRLLKKRTKTCWVSCYQDRGNVFFKESGNLHSNNAGNAIILFGRHYNLTEYLSLHQVSDIFEQMKCRLFQIFEKFYTTFIFSYRVFQQGNSNQRYKFLYTNMSKGCIILFSRNR